MRGKSLRPGKLVMVAAAALALVASGCASRRTAPPAGAGFGLGPQAGQPAPLATGAPSGDGFGHSAVSSKDWDITVALSPTDAQVEEARDKWTVSTSDSRGALTVLAIRDPGVRSARDLADLLRHERMNKGEDVSEVEEDTLVGYPAARWVSVTEGNVATLVLLAHHEPCVYMLIASSKGTTEEIVEYFKWAVGLVHTVSGGAASGPACR